MQLIFPGLARHESEERRQTAGLDGSGALVQGSRFSERKNLFLRSIEIGSLEQVSGKKGQKFWVKSILFGPAVVASDPKWDYPISMI